MNIVLIVSLSLGAVIIVALVIAVIAIMVKRPPKAKVNPTEEHAMKSMNTINEGAVKVDN